MLRFVYDTVCRSTALVHTCCNYLLVQHTPKVAPKPTVIVVINQQIVRGTGYHNNMRRRERQLYLKKRRANSTTQMFVSYIPIDE